MTLRKFAILPLIRGKISHIFYCFVRCYDIDKTFHNTEIEVAKLMKLLKLNKQIDENKMWFFPIVLTNLLNKVRIKHLQNS